jgi:hypothetical protein
VAASEDKYTAADLKRISDHFAGLDKVIENDVQAMVSARLAPTPATPQPPVHLFLSCSVRRARVEASARSGRKRMVKAMAYYSEKTVNR